MALVLSHKPSPRLWLTLLGAALLLAALVWRFHLAQPWLARIPPNWSFQAEFLAEAAMGDGSLQVPEERLQVVWRRRLTVLEWQPERALVEDHYQVLDVHDGRQVWASRLRFEVDPRSGRHLHYPGHPEAAGHYLLFPRQARQQDYQLFNNNLNLYTLSYRRTEKLDGTPLYVYRFRGPLEATGWYTGSEGYPGVPVATDQTILAPEVTVEYWVEPASGELIRITEASAGDWLVEGTEKKRLALLGVWAGTSTASSSHDLLKAARHRLQELTLVSLWVPGLLALSGALLIVLAQLLSRRT